MIRISDITFSYKNSPRILKDFSMSLDNGERINLSGPSGSGKTTLLRLIMGLERPEKGEIFNDFNRIAPVFQEDRLVKSLSVKENIMFGNRGFIKEIPSSLGLDDLLEKNITELSGGELRRVCLARALMHEGDLLIMDEPFNGMDEENILKAAEAIEKFSKGSALILVTHHPKQAMILGCREIKL